MRRLGAALAVLLTVAVVLATPVVALDGDDVVAVEELLDGTDPLAADTDGDGLDDGREAELGTDPTAADADDDGLDGEEVTLSGSRARPGGSTPRGCRSRTTPAS